MLLLAICRSASGDYTSRFCRMLVANGERLAVLDVALAALQAGKVRAHLHHPHPLMLTAATADVIDAPTHCAYSLRTAMLAPSNDCRIGGTASADTHDPT